MGRRAWPSAVAAVALIGVRLLEWLAVQCHNSEDKYLTKAAQSDENGRSRAAERFRKRAAWTRNEAERNRRGAQQLRSRGGFRL